MAQAKSDYIVEVIGVDKTGAAMASVSQHMDGITASTVRATAAAGKHESVTAAINKSYLSLRAIVGDVSRAVGAMVGHLKEGGRALQLDQQINALAGGVEKVEALRSGVMGTLDTTTLQQYTLMLDRIGVSAQQAADIGLFALEEAQRRNIDTGAALQQVMQALATGDAGSFKAMGIRATDSAGVMRQMAAIGAAAMGALEKNIAVGTDRIAASWDNMVSDMQTGFAQFVYGVANGYHDLVSSMAQTTADSIPKMKELMKLSEEITVLESGIFAGGGTVFGGGGGDIKDRARLEALKAREQAILASLKGQAAGGGQVFARGGSPPAPFDADYEQAYLKFYDKLDAKVDEQRRTRSEKAGKEAAEDAVKEAKRVRELTIKGARETAKIIAAIGAAERERAGQASQAMTGMGGGGGSDNRGWFGKSGKLGEEGMVNAAGPMLSRSQQELANFAADMEKISDRVGGAFGSIGGAFGGMVDLLTNTGAISKTGAAAKALAGFQIAAIVATAGIKMAFEIAEATAAGARYDYWGAAQHIAAAAQYGVVAATSVASTVAGVSGGGGSSSVRSGGRAGGDEAFTAARGRMQPGGDTYIIVNADTINAGDRSSGEWLSRRVFPELGRRGVQVPPDMMRHVGRRAAGM